MIFTAEIYICALPGRYIDPALTFVSISDSSILPNSHFHTLLSDRNLLRLLHQPAVNKSIYAVDMCIQTIGVCTLSHSEHLGFHFCSLLISRGLWNPFECSTFEALEIDSYHWSCQTCLEHSVGWKIYNDRSVTLKLWRAVSRKIRHHRKRRSRRHTGWEMQNICAVDTPSGVPRIQTHRDMGD